MVASGCQSHLILMTANYPLRWDTVPAGYHGDITWPSVNAGAAARNHSDPELAGKTVWNLCDVDKKTLRHTHILAFSGNLCALGLRWDVALMTLIWFGVCGKVWICQNKAWFAIALRRGAGGKLRVYF